MMEQGLVVDQLSPVFSGLLIYLHEAVLVDLHWTCVYVGSCMPNLANHQVLVNSMDSQRAHIGLYASRDVSTLLIPS